MSKNIWSKTFRKLVNKHKVRILAEEDVILEKRIVAKSDHVLADMLSKAYDRCEGMYSKIPECCVNAYVDGLRAKFYMDHKDIEIRKKFTGWNYVPCSACFESNNKVKIKHNGVSFQGKIILDLMKYFRGHRH